MTALDPIPWEKPWTSYGTGISVARDRCSFLIQFACGSEPFLAGQRDLDLIWDGISEAMALPRPAVDTEKMSHPNDVHAAALEWSCAAETPTAEETGVGRPTSATPPLIDEIDE